MSIFINKETRIVVQGVTGQEGSFWTKHMLDMGATVVAGVTPGKEGQDVHGVPVFHTVAGAVETHAADAAMLFVPPRFTKDAIYEACVYTLVLEHVPQVPDWASCAAVCISGTTRPHTPAALGTSVYSMPNNIGVSARR